MMTGIVVKENMLPYQVLKLLMSTKELFVSFSSPYHLSLVKPTKKIISTHFTQRFPISFVKSYFFESLLYAYRDYRVEFFYQPDNHPYHRTIHLKIQNDFFSIEFVKFE